MIVNLSLTMALVLLVMAYLWANWRLHKVRDWAFFYFMVGLLVLLALSIIWDKR